MNSKIKYFIHQNNIDVVDKKTIEISLFKFIFYDILIRELYLKLWINCHILAITQKTNKL